MDLMQQQINEDEWEAKYKPLLDDDNFAQQFETFGDEYKQVINTDPRLIWTAVEGDNGDLLYASGFHLVNRLHFYLCQVPFELNESIEVILD